MTISVGSLWAIYIVVVIVSLLIFWLLLTTAQYYYNSLGYGTVFLFSTLFGALAVFIGTAWIDPNQLNSTDKTWLSVLFVIAFVLPILIIIYIIWVGEYTSIVTDEYCNKPCNKSCNNLCNKPCNKSCNKSCDNIEIKQIIECDDNICKLKERTIVDGNKQTTVIYK